MDTKELIEKMSNKDLAQTINRIREEKANPNKPRRFVTESEFWGGHHGDLKRELERRKKSGLIGRRAGTSLKKAIRQKANPFGLPSMNDLMRM